MPVILFAFALHAGKVFEKFLTEITLVSRLSSRLARDNFLNFPKTFSGLLYAYKITGILLPDYPIKEAQQAVDAGGHDAGEYLP